jgi:hypothetical protein
MARNVCGKVSTSGNAVKTPVGIQLIEVLTSGMYSDPLMVLREYVQNSADALDQACIHLGLQPSKGFIRIEINGRERSIVLEDNGTGVGNADAAALLCGVGLSSKAWGMSRGFRGIGRLGGLGYCKILRFETRAAGESYVTSVVWDALAVTRAIEGGRTVWHKDTLGHAVRLLRRPVDAGEPEHFFRVEMLGVQRFHHDVLMDVRAIRRYLAHASPVGYDDQAFHFANELNREFADIEGFRSYDISVNGQKVLRPYRQEFRISKNVSDKIDSVQTFRICSREGLLLGKGWYANTKFLAAVPKHTQMRGIRVRQGNIQVGDEDLLAGCFAENRFSSWHIGEVHLRMMVRPNARRDGFEHNSNCECFLEHMHRLGKHLSQLCRLRSSQRSLELRVCADLGELERLLAQTVFVDADHSRRAEEKISRLMAKVNKLTRDVSFPEEVKSRLARCHGSMEEGSRVPVLLRQQLDRERLAGLHPIMLIEDVCRRALKAYGPSEECQDLIEVIAGPYLK